MIGNTGLLDVSGKVIGDIVSFQTSGWPYEKNIKWRYYDGTDFITTVEDDVIVKCIDQKSK